MQDCQDLTLQVSFHGEILEAMRIGYWQLHAMYSLADDATEFGVWAHLLRILKPGPLGIPTFSGDW